MELLLSDKAKFEKVHTKKGLLNFTVNHEKRIKEYLKPLKSWRALSIEHYKRIKAAGSRPGILYGLCKVHKNIVDKRPLFGPILSAIGTPSYEIAKFLVPRMNFITSNESNVKDTFCFPKEIVEQRNSWTSFLVMGSWGVYSLFTNIPLDENINICTKTVYSEQDAIEGINKEEFWNLLSLATKKILFYFQQGFYWNKRIEFQWVLP